MLRDVGEKPGCPKAFMTYHDMQYTKPGIDDYDEINSRMFEAGGGMIK